MKQWVLNSNGGSFFTYDEIAQFYQDRAGKESLKFRVQHGMVTDDGEGNLWCGDRIIGTWQEVAPLPPPAPPPPPPSYLPPGYAVPTGYVPPTAMPMQSVQPMPMLQSVPMPQPEPVPQGMPMPMRVAPAAIAPRTASAEDVAALASRMDDHSALLGGITHALTNLHNALVSWFTTNAPMTNPPPAADAPDHPEH